jgi:hypothetical protein
MMTKLKYIASSFLLAVTILPLGAQNDSTGWTKPQDCKPFLRKASLISEMNGKKTSRQGADVYGNLLFDLANGGTCRVYDLKEAEKPLNAQSGKYLGEFTLGSAASENHCNAASFGPSSLSFKAQCRNASKGRFPLLLVSVGKAGVPSEFDLHVEKITRDKNGVFSSRLIQTISLDTTGFTSNGYIKTFGCPNWMIDKERGYLCAFSAIRRSLVETGSPMGTNRYVATIFRLPAYLRNSEKVSELPSKLVLTYKDIVSQHSFEFATFFTQAGYMSNGKIYYLFGTKSRDCFGNMSPKMVTFDIDTDKVTARMDLNGVVLEEPEDCCFYQGNLLINVNGDKVYRMGLAH